MSPFKAAPAGHQRAVIKHLSCYGFLSDRLLAALQAEHTQRARAYAGQLTRAEYEARLAKRQYLAIDPDNRLVAAALERR